MSIAFKQNIIKKTLSTCKVPKKAPFKYEVAILSFEKPNCSVLILEIFVIKNIAKKSDIASLTKFELPLKDKTSFKLSLKKN